MRENVRCKRESEMRKKIEEREIQDEGEWKSKKEKRYTERRKNIREKNKEDRERESKEVG